MRVQSFQESCKQMKIWRKKLKKTKDRNSLLCVPGTEKKLSWRWVSTGGSTSLSGSPRDAAPGPTTRTTAAALDPLIDLHGLFFHNCSYCFVIFHSSLFPLSCLLSCCLSCFVLLLFPIFFRVSIMFVCLVLSFLFYVIFICSCVSVVFFLMFISLLPIWTKKQKQHPKLYLFKR